MVMLKTDNVDCVHLLKSHDVIAHLYLFHSLGDKLEDARDISA